ncbi:hypothetical protein D9M72_402670 [compost metagenome]
MIQVPEELIEAMQRWQELVQIAKMVLAELAGGVSLGLEDGGNRCGLVRHTDVCARLSDRRQASAQRDFTCDEACSPRGAACFRVVVGK